MTLIKHESVEAVKEAVDMIDLVSGTHPDEALGRRVAGPLPVP